MLFLVVLSTDVAPFSETDFADPFVLRDEGRYYAFATGANGTNLRVARSENLTTWSLMGDPLPRLPSWATHGLTWAPSVLRRDGTYVLYYTARDTASDFQCISRAVAPRPEGPYVDTSERPFVCQTSLCGSIDPSPFVDASGRAHLLWKSDENALRCRGAARLWTQELSANGLDLAGVPVPLLTMDRDWEQPLIEGPSMVADAGRYYLFYSANWYESPRYSVGYAVCSSPVGPCTKADGPWLRSDGTMLGPGGQEVFEGPRGPTLAYHAWTAPHATYAEGGARSLRFGQLAFRDGVPVLAR
jgi:beta-xylosidase